MTCTAVAALLYTSTIGLTREATGVVIAIVGALEKHQPQIVANNLQLLAETCLLVVAVFFVRYLLVRGQIYYLSLGANRLAADLRQRLFDKLLKLPVSFFSDRKAGAIQSVLANDVNVYQNAINIIQDSIAGPIKAIGAFVTILVIQPYLAIIAIAFIPIMVVLLQRNSAKMKVAQHEVQEDLANLSSVTFESLQGVRVIKAFGSENTASKNYQSLNFQSFRSQMRAAITFANLRPLVEFLGAISLSILLYVGGLLATHGMLKAEDIVALAVAMDLINQGFKNLSGLTGTLASVTVASNRIYGQVLDIPEDESESSGRDKIKNPKGKIEFRDVSFNYPDGTEALSGVSFILEPGKSLAVVGPSGAGKSTLADLLLQFYAPTTGQILLDDVDVANLDSNWMRSLIAVVPQETFLFAGTIEENVRVGKESASEGDVKRALKAAHAEDFSKEMADRTSTQVGERGGKLSGGQMQRVAIARALIREPLVLILDEATSALDAASERIVTDALQEIMVTRTTLLIAHRLTTAARADSILLIKNGHVIEQGSHSELIARGGEYAALFTVFSGGILPDGIQ